MQLKPELDLSHTELLSFQCKRGPGMGAIVSENHRREGKGGINKTKKRCPFENWTWLLLSEYANIALSLAKRISVHRPTPPKHSDHPLHHSACWHQELQGWSFPQSHHCCGWYNWSSLPLGWASVNFQRLRRRHSLFLKKLVCEVIRQLSSWIFAIEQMTMTILSVFTECT